MNLHRRGFITGLGALIAVPAIVRVASIMPVSNRMLTSQEIMRQIVEMLSQSNSIIENINLEYAARHYATALMPMLTVKDFRPFATPRGVQ